MTAFRFKSVSLEAFAVNLPTTEVTSAEIEDRLAPVYQRLGIPFGTLEKLSGIRSRFLWPDTESPSKVGTVAAREALERSGIAPENLGAIINCSVSRDFFEPATAALIHRNLGLPSSVMALDISNACIGFSNGLTLVANMIESGAIKAGLIVSGETVTRIVDSTTKAVLANEDLTREDLLKVLPSFTLGSGAVAFVLCHESLSKSPHRVAGAVAHTASEFNDLCNGNGDFSFFQSRAGVDNNPLMHTESALLISSAAKLGGRTWREASELLGWSTDSLSHIFCHQVGRQVNEAFYREMGLPMDKEFTIYRKYGNLVSAALPTAFALGSKEREFKRGDRMVFTAYGSGLNSLFTGIEW